MEHVRPQAVHGQVAQGSPCRKLVGAQERGVDHACGLADEGAHQLVELRAGRPFGQQREQDVAGVVVGEPLAGTEHGCVPVQGRQVLLGRRELMDRD